MPNVFQYVKTYLLRWTPTGCYELSWHAERPHLNILIHVVFIRQGAWHKKIYENLKASPNSCRVNLDTLGYMTCLGAEHRVHPIIASPPWCRRKLRRRILKLTWRRPFVGVSNLCHVPSLSFATRLLRLDMTNTSSRSVVFSVITREGTFSGYARAFNEEKLTGAGRLTRGSPQPCNQNLTR